MGDFIVLPGVRRRLLRFDPTTMALRLAPKLDDGDRQGAMAIWADWRAKAIKTLNAKKITPAARDALIKQATAEVRSEIVAIRGSAKFGIVPADQRPATARPAASIIQFPRRIGGGG